jgi:hypothetical protein
VLASIFISETFELIGTKNLGDAGDEYTASWTLYPVCAYAEIHSNIQVAKVVRIGTRFFIAKT